MTTISQTVVVDPATAALLLGPRRDLVTEHPLDPRTGDQIPRPDVGSDHQFAAFGLERGPMHHYRREVEAEDLGDGTVRVTETTRFTLALGIWGAFVALPIRAGLRRVEGRDRTRTPWWAPPEQLDSRAGTVLGLLLGLAVVAGFLGTVITQTVKLAAEEFDRGTTAQSGVLAAVRIGVLGALVLVAVSDRRGRRRVLLGALAGSCAFTVLGAAAPSIELLGVSQAAARGLSTTALLLLAIVAAEEMPKGARAYALSVMAMTGALGAGVSLWVLALVGDRAEWGWRVVYLVALLGFPVLLHARRHLPESLRFVRPHRDATVVRGHGRRLWALGLAFFCSSALASPASQLLIDFLLDERGFSAAGASLFTVVTSTPGGIGLVIGGRLADTRGRRHVVAVGVAGGAIFGTWTFALEGWPMWVANLLATVLAALAVPALRAYGPELFPTAARARANGIVEVVSVGGSAMGLLVAGLLADRTGRLYDGMLLLTPLGLVVAALALFVFPETARRELEDINPEDDLARPAEGVVLAGPDEGPPGPPPS